MKTQSYLLSAGLAGIILLSGCAETQIPGTPDVQKTQQTSMLKNESSVNSSASIAIQGTEEAVVKDTVSNEDRIALGTATQLGDVKYCEKISNAKLKEQCSVDIKDTLQAGEAVSKNDPLLCDKLSTPDKQQSCKIQIEVNKVQNQQKEQKDQQFEKLNQVVATGDLNACATLGDPVFIENCKTNIIFTKAVQENNYALCDKIADQTNQQLCHQMESTNHPSTQQ